MSAGDIEIWKSRIRNDALSNYCHSMAVAVWQMEGVATAFRWVEAARSSLSRTDVTAWLGRSMLNELGRMAEAETIHAAALAVDPNYEVSALRQIAAIHAATNAMPLATTVSMFDQAVTTARHHGSLDAALLLTLQRSAYVLRRIQTATITADTIREAAASLFPSSMLTETARQDIVAAAADLANVAVTAGRSDLAEAVVHLLVALAKPEEINADQLALMASLLPPALENVRKEGTDLRQGLGVLLGRMAPVGPGAGPALTRLSHFAFRSGDSDLGERAAHLCLAVAPDVISLRSRVARERWMRGDREGALAIFQTDTPSPMTRAHLAMYLAAAGRTEEALAVGCPVLAEAPENHMVQSCAGSALVASGRSAELVERLAPFDVQGTGPVIALTLALLALRRHRDCLALLGKLSEPAASVALAISQTIKAVVLEDMGQTEEAEDLYRLVARTGDSAEMLFHSQIRPTVAARMLAGLQRGGMTFAEQTPTG